MCYELIACPRCGELVDEMGWDDHQCRTPLKQKMPIAEPGKEIAPEILA